MGLKDFLKKQGFIQDDAAGSTEDEKRNRQGTHAAAKSESPVFFPIQQNSDVPESPPGGADPSFVAPLQKASVKSTKPDANFVKFFEDELVKANLEGPDYFEFRQQLIKTQQKMSAKGLVASDVILQAVITSFEAQGVTADKLVQAAQHYKEVIKDKNDEFIKGAETEKNNQLQKRQSVLQQHTDNIQKLQQQIQQLDLQKQQLTESLDKEKTQLEVNKTLGQEGIEKIDKAERLIGVAYEYMKSTIDDDIKKLNSV